VVTTRIVADEFGKDLPEWIKIQNSNDVAGQLVLETALGKGEASAIALALEMMNCLLIIDEQKGRKLAKHLGLTITGTLGVLVQAKRKGYISMIKPLLDKMKQTDFRLSEQLVRETLKEVGE
jgi:predicted nucleic acid-binding protein